MKWHCLLLLLPLLRCRQRYCYRCFHPSHHYRCFRRRRFCRSSHSHAHCLCHRSRHFCPPCRWLHSISKSPRPLRRRRRKGPTRLQLGAPARHRTRARTAFEAESRCSTSAGHWRCYTRRKRGRPTPHREGSAAGLWKSSGWRTTSRDSYFYGFVMKFLLR